MVVRFSYGHAKHEAMEAAGLFEGAWPPVLYPPHRATRTLAARLLGATCLAVYPTATLLGLVNHTRFSPVATNRGLLRASCIAGGAPSEEEEREHAILRSQELQQYYERVFRLPAVTQVRSARVALREIV